MVQIKPYGKSELADMYATNVETLMRWLRPFSDDLEEMGYRKMQRIFTPRQVKFIFETIGEPNEDTKRRDSHQ